MLLDNADQSEALDRNSSFTTVTRAGTRVWPASQAAILIDDTLPEPIVLEMGLVTRSPQRVATGVHRLKYVRRKTFDFPVTPQKLIEALPARSREALEERIRRGGVLPNGSAAAVVEEIAKLSPTDGLELRRLIGDALPPEIRGQGLQSAAQEADAVRLALDIAGIPRNELRGVRPDGYTSFLERLEYVRASEDTTIAYDSMRFLDFDRLDTPAGVVTFRKGGERLIVANVNRQPLEHTTGADLIYINEPLRSFVLVQYKTMRREPGDLSRMVYRPDDQLLRELERMRKFGPAADDGTPASYRLSSATCFLKLCKPVTTLDRGRDLVSGMYLPLDYYDVLTSSPDVRGPRGGVVLSYDTVQRHVSNDLFVGLVRGGWIGSRGATSAELEDLVLSGLNAGRSITVAASTDDSSSGPI
jgi:hypothetical protein